MLSILSGWLAVSKIRLALEYWRWGSFGRALGHALGALPLLTLAITIGFAPIAIAIVKCRSFFHGAREA